jgi:hypothetical protein
VVGVGVLALVGYGIQRAGGAKRRRVPVWTCGEEHEPGEVRYLAGSFYVPFKHAVQGLYPSFRFRIPRFPSFLRRAFEIDTWLYSPVARLVERATRGTSRTHLGTPQAYLLWIVVGAATVVGVIFAVMT